MLSCIDCEYHRIASDPDPNDSFCDDDVAVLCEKLPPQESDSKRWIDDSPFKFKTITVSCRPYNIRKETSIPIWCPLNS